MVSLNLNEKLFPPEEPIEELEGDALKEAIIRWFYSNFENPAESTSYNGREGGYLYIMGGPYDAREQIEGYFGDSIPEVMIDEVVEKLDRDSDEWAPSGNRIYDEDPPEDDYGTLQRALDDLEAKLGEARAVSPAIGDNNPPEAIGVPPYSSDDESEIRQIIELLRAPERVLLQNADKVLEAATLFRTRSEKIREFFTGQGKKVADAFSEELGKRTADGILFGLGIALGAAFDAVKNLLAGALSHLPF